MRVQKTAWLLGLAVVFFAGCNSSSGSGDGNTDNTQPGDNNTPTNPVDPSPTNPDPTNPDPDPVDPGPGGTTYTISTNVIGPGSISPTQEVLTIPNGESQFAVFTLTPNSGAGVINVSGCGIYASPFGNNAYWTDTITADCTVEVEFALGFTVSQAQGSFESGTFNPTPGRPPQFIRTGETATIDFSNEITNVNLEVVADGCDGTLTGNTFTTGPVNANCTVNYEIRNIQHALTLNVTGEGAVMSVFQDNATPTVVLQGVSLPLNIEPDAGWYLESVTGCGITPVANQPTYNYELPSATAACTLDVTFAELIAVTVTPGPNGSVGLLERNWSLEPGETFSFTALPAAGYSLGSVTGCPGTFVNNVFTSEPINAACNVDVSFIQGTTLAVEVESPKTLRFSWQPVTGAGEYRLLVIPDGTITQEIIPISAAATEFARMNVSLPLDIGASYRVRACETNGGNCTATTSADRVDLTANVLIAGIAQLNPDAAATSIQQAFGHAVAVSHDGSTIAIGAPGPMTGTKETGRVSIWRNNNGSWDRLGDIQPPSTVNVFEFGYSLALSENGSTLVVGAPGDKTRARGIFTSQGFAGETLDSESGATYVFTYNQAQNRFDYRAHFKADPRNGSQQLDASNAVAVNSARFGHSVAISNAGDRIVVGAPGESTEYTGIYTSSNRAATSNASQGSNSGAVFVYALTLVNPTWQQALYIKPSDTTAMSRFGSSVAADGNVTSIAVGAPESGGSSIPEKLYVFDTTTAGNPNFNWGERGNFNLNGNRNQDLFGSAVAMSQDGNTIAVGAYAAGGFDGAAYIMHKEEMAAWGDAWLEKRSVTPQGLTSSLMNFGYSLALTDDGSKLLVGARTENSDVQGLSSFASPGASNLHDQAGAAFLFSYDASTWTLTEDVLIKAPSPLASRRFGHAAAMSGDASVILIGEPDNASEESDRGRAYLY